MITDEHCVLAGELQSERIDAAHWLHVDAWDLRPRGRARKREYSLMYGVNSIVP